VSWLTRLRSCLCEFFFPHFEVITDSACLFPAYFRFIIAWVCVGVGAAGLLILWWRWRKNYIWALNKIWTYVVPSSFFPSELKKLTRFPPLPLSTKRIQPRPLKLLRRPPLHAIQHLWRSTWPASQDQQSDPDRHRCVYECLWDFDGRLFVVTCWEGEEEA